MSALEVEESLLKIRGEILFLFWARLMRGREVGREIGGGRTIEIG